MMENKISPVT